MQTISFNEIMAKVAENKDDKLRIQILLDLHNSTNSINELQLYFNGNDVNTITKYITNSIKKTQSGLIQYLTVTKSGNNIKSTKTIKYKLDKLPVILNFYKSINNPKSLSDKNLLTKTSQKPLLVYKKIYTNTKDDWIIRLIIEKTYTKIPKNKNAVDWDNNDEIYIELEYTKNPISINITELKLYLKKFLLKKGGSEGLDTKSYIIEMLNRYIKPIKPFRYIYDAFNPTALINRTEYFNIINTMDKIDYCINTSYSGINYIIVIDSEKNIVYYSTKSYTEESVIASDCGFCILTAIKSHDFYIIKKVIIDNGIIVNDNNVNQINDRNEKFGKILNMKTTTYSEINLKTYKKQIELKNDELKNKVKNLDFIEFSQISNITGNTYYLHPIYQWSPKILPIIFYCMECPMSYLNSMQESTKSTTKSTTTSTKKPTLNKTQVLYILFLTINIKDFKNSGIQLLPFHKELFGDINGFFMPVQFTPSTMPNAFMFYSDIPDLNKKFISLAYNIKLNNWIFVEKVNPSDTNIYGDDFRKTETQVWNSYRNPVSYDDLIIDKTQISDSMYFVALKNKAHESPIKLNNFVKSSLINKYAMASKSVIDLASGRASDLMNYRLARINELLFIEIDKDAVDIVIDRKYILDNPNKTQLKIFNTNLNDPYKSNLAVINNTFMNYKVPNIFCFFALHYLTTTLSQIQNIAALISNLLEKDGTFLYTAFDANQVINLLDKNSGKWEIFEKGVKKYSIMSDYKTKDINTPKRPIKLILPFNSNTYYYDENLINDEILDKEFSKHKLTVEYEGNFLDFLDKFKEKKYMFYNNLTDADKTFVGLYKYKIFKKI